MCARPRPRKETPYLANTIGHVNSAPAAYKWRPIEDLPSGWRDLESHELHALAHVWQDQRRDLEAMQSLQEFNRKLLRQWAVETGIIEKLYTLDRGITQLLVEHGLEASLIPRGATNQDPNLVINIIRDQHEAVEGLFDFVKRRRSLTTSYMKELHALLTRHQRTTTAVDQFGHTFEVDLLHGEYKSQPNNPQRPDGSIHEYCPPEHVAAEMDLLVEFHLRHEKERVPPEIEAAWLHHRFSQIHPFQDGNGRVARAIASLVFIRAGWFPLTITGEDKERIRYIDSLETADAGNLGPLVELFATAEKRTFVDALSIARDVVRQEQVDQVIGAVRVVFEARQGELERAWERAKELAGKLFKTAHRRFEETAAKLESELRAFSKSFRFFVDKDPPGNDRAYWFRHQWIETAKSLGYFANPATYAAWVRLVMSTDDQAEILLTFHGIGHEYRGVIAASLCFFRRVETGEGKDIADLTVVSDEYFQVNYRDKEKEAGRRFEQWLDQSLVKGLEIWRRSL